jgi:hypothetical protein
MPAIIERCLTRIGPPHHHVRDTAANLVIASRASIGLDGPRAGDRPHRVLVPIGASLQTLLGRHR